MAMNAGLGFSKILILVGAGYTGTVLLKNGKLSDVLGELQHLVKGMEKSGESNGGDSEYSDAIAAQVRRLAMEVRQLASSKQITVLNGNSSSSNLTPLIMPVAALGALGYGYMWWKATKRHLTQRIENLDGKLDEQVEISKLIRSEVGDARGDISQIGFDLDELQRMVSGLDGKLLSLEGKQELANAGVMYLCSIVSGRKVKMPEMLQDQFKIGGNTVPSLMGLKEIADSLASGNNLLTDGNVQDGTDKLKDPPRNLMRNCQPSKDMDEHREVVEENNYDLLYGHEMNDEL
ncbi:hypothetical protein Fot_35418 [Forsythia ovata]|uniref:DUF1664 domain-containing protein n=1 Tax=Forsythia ovata TaxID=205694 RepID=A0ABD1SLR8_9LAMI